MPIYISRSRNSSHAKKNTSLVCRPSSWSGGHAGMFSIGKFDVFHIYLIARTEVACCVSRRNRLVPTYEVITVCIPVYTRYFTQIISVQLRSTGFATTWAPPPRSKVFFPLDRSFTAYLVSLNIVPYVQGDKVVFGVQGDKVGFGVQGDKVGFGVQGYKVVEFWDHTCVSARRLWGVLCFWCGCTRYRYLWGYLTVSSIQWEIVFCVY